MWMIIILGNISHTYNTKNTIKLEVNASIILMMMLIMVDYLCFHFIVFAFLVLNNNLIGYFYNIKKKLFN